MKKILDEVKRTNGQVILFIDEIHTVIGAGAAEGAIDAASILKPSLARGEIKLLVQQPMMTTESTLKGTPLLNVDSSQFK